MNSQIQVALNGTGPHSVMDTPTLSPRALEREECEAIANHACSRIAPMWGLENFVAVNPFWGFKDKDFLGASRLLKAYTARNIFMEKRYYSQKFAEGRITEERISSIIARLRDEAGLPDYLMAKMNSEALTRWLQTDSPEVIPQPILSFPEAFDELENTAWNKIFVNELSRFCALYFDKGQAAWSAPFKSRPLLEAWNEFASSDKTLELNGLRGVRQFFQSLPTTSSDIIHQYATVLKLGRDELEHVLAKEMFTIKGWAAYVQHLDFEKAKVSDHGGLITDLLAARLGYSLLLIAKRGYGSCISLLRQRLQSALGEESEAVKTMYFQAICQEALEATFLDRLLRTICPQKREQRGPRAKVQAVFCIDVRSERFRSALEQQEASLETYGFAGFFGLPFRYKEAGGSSDVTQYPVLLKSTFAVVEREHAAGVSRWFRPALLNSLIKALRHSINSGFTFVETFGGIYILQMIRKFFCLKKFSEREREYPDLEVQLTLQGKLEVAQAMLKNMGLRQPFAPVVLLAGHQSRTTNNPFAAGLDCGACGGHGGGANAIVAAEILNDQEVRMKLRGTDYEIPVDTIFVPAVHNTTTDDVEVFLKNAEMNSQQDILALKRWLTAAGDAGRLLRAESLGISEPPSSLGAKTFLRRQTLKRSLDWSEVRPEWGLARNGAFIAARRELTRTLDLEGRCFLHSYDYLRDKDFSTLELILTAPMVVASWINLQYYGSSVAPDTFGAGNKIIHNVVGQLGVLEGNDGDLKLGLPFQSVHTGTELFHEPLRLQVIIEAPPAAILRIIQRHQLLRDLVFNEWVKIFSLDGETGELRQISSKTDLSVALH